jgi:hypothetical protein
MRAFIKRLSLAFVIILSMKLPAQDDDNQSLNTGCVISELQDLLSKKSDVSVQ